MRTQSTTTEIDAVSASFSTRCNVQETALPYWRGRIETHLAQGHTGTSTLALCTVEMVSHLITRTLTGTRDKRQSKGGNPDAGGLAVPSGLDWRETMACLVSQVSRAKRGKRQPLTLSETDREEIRGTVSLVLATRGAFSRPLESADIGECFRMVESRTCLDLNRRWKPCLDGEKTLAQLALCTYDEQEERERIAALGERMERIQSCIDAAFAADVSRQAKHNRKTAIAMAQAIVTRSQSGKGISKSRERKERADFAAYVKLGALALQRKALGGKWAQDLVSALDLWAAENAMA